MLAWSFYSRLGFQEQEVASLSSAVLLLAACLLYALVCCSGWSCAFCTPPSEESAVTPSFRWKHESQKVMWLVKCRTRFPSLSLLFSFHSDFRWFYWMTVLLNLFSSREKFKCHWVLKEIQPMCWIQREDGSPNSLEAESRGGARHGNPGTARNRTEVAACLS